MSLAQNAQNYRLLIDEETASPTALGKVPAQINRGIKNVIVITDHRVRPDRQVQRKLERADLMFLAHRFEDGAGDFLPFQRLAHRRQTARS